MVPAHTKSVPMKTIPTIISLMLAFQSLHASPLIHTVFFEFKEEITPREVHSFKEESLHLADIPDVQHLRWLEETSSKNDYRYGLRMQFSDRPAYQRYLEHPTHVRFVETAWNPQVKAFIEIDYVELPAVDTPTIELLDENLTKWETWIGVPHPSVKNLPSQYPTSASMNKGTPIGLADPTQVYTTFRNANQETILRVSGEIYGGLTSKAEYENYHLTLQFKWGESKWAPRLERKRDSGLLYHCYGDHGAMWGVWKRSLEMQIQEGDFGDLFRIGRASATTRVDENNVWTPKGKPNTKGRVIRSHDAEFPHGEWNTLDLYVLEDQAIHVVNGEVVLAVTHAVDHRGTPLRKGQIQLQSEGAECFYKSIYLTPISSFPKEIQRALE